MTVTEVREVADAINTRWRAFDPDGAVRFGIEEAAYAVAEVLSSRDASFDALDFKRRCFK